MRGSLLAAVAVLLVGVASSAVSETYPDQSTALAACKASAHSSYPDRPQATTDSYCGVAYPIYSSDAPVGDPTRPTIDAGWAAEHGLRAYGFPIVSRFNYFIWAASTTPDNPCGTLPHVSLYVDGKMLAGYTFPQNAVDPNTGATVQCAMTFTPSGAPIFNPYSGKWQTYGSAAPSGNLASGSGVKDGQGGDVPAVAPPSDFTDTPSPPSVCDSASCYNPASDQYCASSGGAQYCVSGGTARSSAGGCSGSSVVLCGGSPTPPLPPPSKVPDPPTQIVGQSKATQANPTTGATLPVVVNVYKPPDTAGSVSNGQTSGDSGPAPASSSPSNGSASGGQDCNSPPICSGDAPTCAVVSQSWLQRCGTSKADADGDGMPDWVTKGLDDVGPPVGDTPVGSVVKTETTDTSVIDESGWAGNTCPQLPTITLLGHDVTFGDQALFCQWLAVLRGVFLLICAFISARILAGSKS